MTGGIIYLADMQAAPRKSLEVVVENRRVQLPPGLTYERSIELWAARERENNELPPDQRRKLENKERYFLERISPEGVFHCVNGYFSDFSSSQMQFQAEIKRGMEPEEIQGYFESGLGALGVGVMTTTSDGKLLFQLRSGRVSHSDGEYMFPAGGFMPNDFSDGRRVTPFTSAHNIVEREHGLTILPENMSYIGFTYGTGTGAENLTLCFIAKTECTFDEVRSKSKNAAANREYSNLVAVDERDIMKIMDGSAPSPVHPVHHHALGGLLMYGLIEKGPSWGADAVVNLREKLHVENVRVTR